jgi:hypothetical protein
MAHTTRPSMPLIQRGAKSLMLQCNIAPRTCADASTGPHMRVEITPLLQPDDITPLIERMNRTHTSPEYPVRQLFPDEPGTDSEGLVSSDQDSQSECSTIESPRHGIVDDYIQRKKLHLRLWWMVKGQQQACGCTCTSHTPTQSHITPAHDNWKNLAKWKNVASLMTCWPCHNDLQGAGQQHKAQSARKAATTQQKTFVGSRPNPVCIRSTWHKMFWSEPMSTAQKHHSFIFLWLRRRAGVACSLHSTRDNLLGSRCKAVQCYDDPLTPSDD